MSTTTFDSFNARTLRAQDVANTFVENPEFRILIQARHTVLLGPRGSGKTTLLKMLTHPALQYWQQLHSVQIELPFTAVYIPTDIHWHHQILYSEDALSHVPSFLNRLSAAFVSHSVMLALIDSFTWKLSAMQDRRCEGDLVRELAAAWKIRSVVASLEGLRLGVKRRVIELGTLMSRAVESLVQEDELRQQPDWFDLDFLLIADHAITAFDTFAAQPQDSRWAMCFDELELAPTWLHTRLFKLPRSVTQKVLFKLSSSPDPDISPDGQVTALNDVDIIRLWNASMTKSRAFCAALAHVVMQRKGIATSTPKDLFGESDENDVETEDTPADAYERGSPEWRLIRDVSSWDGSLRDLLCQRGINPDDPVAVSGPIRDTVLRKIKPIAALRKKFAKPNREGGLARRSRKSIDGYYGVPALYDVTDGNPRRLIRLVEELCDYAKSTAVSTIDRSAQARIVQNLSYLYVDYLQMLPKTRRVIPEWNIEADLYTILREIGRYFSSGLLLGPFPIDPNGTFTIDPNTSNDLLRLLRIASYHGAIVKVDPSITGFFDEMRGRRFRLCYTLSPLYQLPLRLYGPISLSRCLQRLPKIAGRSALTPPSQKGPIQLTIGLA